MDNRTYKKIKPINIKTNIKKQQFTLIHLQYERFKHIQTALSEYNKVINVKNSETNIYE